jgi:O-antigen/teichoic acid export membrane protein
MRNAVASWINLASGVVYSLIITRYIVHTLGAESYGVWTFLVGLATYADLFYLGLGASLVSFAAEQRPTPNHVAQTRLASVCLL